MKTLEEIAGLIHRWENGERWHVDEADECMISLCGICDPSVEDLFTRLNKLAGPAIAAKVRGYNSVIAMHDAIGKRDE